LNLFLNISSAVQGSALWVEICLTGFYQIKSILIVLEEFCHPLVNAAMTDFAKYRKQFAAVATYKP
jgi:hypothetical protein